MDSISYSELRENLKAYLDKVCNDHMPLCITRRNGERVVILSEEDFAGMAETVYLQRSPANAKRLQQAVTRKKKDRVKIRSVKALRDALGV